MLDKQLINRNNREFSINYKLLTSVPKSPATLSINNNKIKLDNVFYQYIPKIKNWFQITYLTCLFFKNY